MVDFPSYQAALEWLFAQTRGGAPRHVARMRALLEKLALPSPPSVVHVVGTNGKGSVSAMLAAAYSAAGRRTGRFISPHVVDFRERIAVNEVWITETEVLDFIRSLPELELAPAFFELTLALALRHFARESVEIAVIEAGVGARRDATRALGNVRAVVITNVGRDHLETLGPSVRDIARDKAEAIRPDVPTLTGASGEALEVIREVAAARRSPLYTPASPLFDIPSACPPATPTVRQNQALAAATLRLQGVPETAIRQGLSRALPARVERFRVGGREIILDGAHNPAAAAALLEQLKRPFTLLFGALPKKLGAETLHVLAPHAGDVIITQIGLEPPPLRAGHTFVADPEAALNEALCRGGAQLAITGSFYLAGRLRPRLITLANARR